MQTMVYSSGNKKQEHLMHSTSIDLITKLSLSIPSHTMLYILYTVTPKPSVNSLM